MSQPLIDNGSAKMLTHLFGLLEANKVDGRLNKPSPPRCELCDHNRLAVTKVEGLNVCGYCLDDLGE